MSNLLCWTPTCSFASSNKQEPVLIDGSVAKSAVSVSQIFKSSRHAKLQCLEAKASGSNPATKPNSIICAECEGKGDKKCTQCLGTGVNSVDHFDGQFKAGGLCWLCRGKRDILCGNCNGAGFIGGFMSTFDE